MCARARSRPRAVQGFNLSCKLFSRRRLRHQHFMETSDIIEGYIARPIALLSRTHPVKPLHIDFYFSAYCANCFRKAINERELALYHLWQCEIRFCLTRL